MFRLNQRAAPTATPSRSRQLLQRGLLFGGGLVLLWLVLQLAPTPPPAEVPPSLFERADPADGLAVRPRSAMPGLFSTGNIVAFVLLVGGVGLAFFLHRRFSEGESPASALHSVGQMTLAPNQQLRLVRCGDEVLLLGVTTGQITLLKSYDFTEFDEANAKKSKGAVVAEAAASLSPSPASAEASFGALLRQQAGRFVNAQQTQAPC